MTRKKQSKAHYTISSENSRNNRHSDDLPMCNIPQASEQAYPPSPVRGTNDIKSTLPDCYGNKSYPTSMSSLRSGASRGEYVQQIVHNYHHYNGPVTIYNGPNDSSSFNASHNVIADNQGDTFSHLRTNQQKRHSTPIQSGEREGVIPQPHQAHSSAKSSSTATILTTSQSLHTTSSTSLQSFDGMPPSENFYPRGNDSQPYLPRDDSSSSSGSSSSTITPSNLDGRKKIQGSRPNSIHDAVSKYQTGSQSRPQSTSSLDVRQLDFRDEGAHDGVQPSNTAFYDQRSLRRSASKISQLSSRSTSSSKATWKQESTKHQNKVQGTDNLPPSAYKQMNLAVKGTLAASFHRKSKDSLSSSKSLPSHRQSSESLSRFRSSFVDPKGVSPLAQSTANTSARILATTHPLQLDLASGTGPGNRASVTLNQQGGCLSAISPVPGTTLPLYVMDIQPHVPSTDARATHNYPPEKRNQTRQPDATARALRPRAPPVHQVGQPQRAINEPTPEKGAGLVGNVRNWFSKLLGRR